MKMNLSHFEASFLFALFTSVASTFSVASSSRSSALAG
jgi:hypothetical protein